MGYRIHVAEVYQVKHCTFDDLKCKQDAINRLLYEHCPSMSWDGEDVDCSERLEVPRAELADLIGWVASSKEQFAEWAKLHQIEETSEQMIAIIAKWISFSDQRNDYVVLTWF